jgi:hypothetical protein
MCLAQKFIATYKYMNNSLECVKIIDRPSCVGTVEWLFNAEMFPLIRIIADRWMTDDIIT